MTIYLNWASLIWSSRLARSIQARSKQRRKNSEFGYSRSKMSFCSNRLSAFSKMVTMFCTVAFVANPLIGWNLNISRLRRTTFSSILATVPMCSSNEAS